MKEPAHRALHPFGQIPTYEEGDLALFESGAIVFHIAERHAGLLPDDANARTRAITWMFAALNTVEPPILDLQNTRFLEGDKTWYKQRLQTSPPMSPAALFDPPTSVLSTLNWWFSLASHRPAETTEVSYFYATLGEKKGGV
jgi:glutathione S-transferase